MKRLLKRKLSYILMFLLTISVTFAQDNDVIISGIVKDASGELLPGVSVIEKGTTNGTITGVDGSYSVNVKVGSTLIYSFIGFKSQEHLVIKTSNVNITLVEEATGLDEVVVVGYGTAKKSDLTGAVASVRPNETEALQNVSVNSLLRGKVSGLEVSSMDGTPGSAISVRIRGTNSLRSDNEPLYVVDGVIMNSVTEDNANSLGSPNDFQMAQDGLTGIHPSDIADIQVLKDASSTAIYGSRGANGVVLITTKRGKEGKPVVKFNHATTIATVGRTYDLLDSYQYGEMTNEAAFLNERPMFYGYNDGNIYEIKGYDDDDRDYFMTKESANLTSEMINKYGWEPLEQVDWIDKMLETSVSNTDRISISGGNKRIKYIVSGGYLNQNGIVPGTKLEQGDARINLSIKVNDRLNIRTNVSGLVRENMMNQASDGTGNLGLMNSILRHKPFGNELVDELGNVIPDPTYWVSDYDDVSEETKFVGALSLDYKLTSWLTYQGRLSGNIRYKDRVRYWSDQIGQGKQEGNGVIGESTLTSRNYQVENLLQFKKSFNKVHSLNGTIGFTTEQYRTISKSLKGTNFSNLILGKDGMANAGNIYYNPPVENPKNFLSGLARINYDYNNRYLVTLSYRRDGVSVFQGDNKWDDFYSTALAWRAENEEFIKNLNIFSQLKVRLGWGQTGNASIAPFQTLNTYTINQGVNTNGNTVNGLTTTRLANPELVWETTEQVNAGLDFGLLKGRIRGSIDVYNKQTKDLLLTKPIPPSTGYDRITINTGSIENKGFELALDATVVQKGNFYWNVGGTFSINKNKIVDLGNEDTFGDGRTHFLGDNLGTSAFAEPVNIFIEGQPLGLFYGYKTDGIYRTEADLEGAPAGAQLGDVRIVDQLTVDTTGDGIPDSPDGVINREDYTFIGDPNPDFVYGFNTEFKYKSLSLRLDFNGKQGMDVFNAKFAQLAYSDKTNFYNILAESWTDRWTPENTDAKYARQGYELTNSSDLFVEDASFLRLSAVTLQYTFSKSFAQSIGLGSLDVFATGNNLLLFTKYKGFDPEISSWAYSGTRIGVDWGSFPRPVSFTFGVNIGF